MTTVAGSGIKTYADGQGSNACFSSPRGVAVDTTGVVYVADYNNHRIRLVSATGEYCRSYDHIM